VLENCKRGIRASSPRVSPSSRRRSEHIDFSKSNSAPNPSLHPRLGLGHDQRLDDIDSEEDDEEDDEDCEEELTIKSLNIKETTLLELNLELEDKTLTYLMNVNPKKKKTIIKLAKRNKEKLIEYFEKHSAILIETQPDGTQKFYANRKRLLQLFFPYQLNGEDLGLEIFPFKAARQRAIYS
jgi:hypothetical protein